MDTFNAVFVVKEEPIEYEQVYGFQIQEIKVEPELLIDDYGKTFACDQCPGAAICYCHLSGRGMPHRKSKKLLKLLKKEIPLQADRFELMYGCCENHIRMHSPVGPYFCDICHGQFKSIHGVKMHMSVHKTNASRWSLTCKICRKQFAHKWGLKIHKQAHRRRQAKIDAKREQKYLFHLMNGPFTCDICYVTFSEITKLKNHVRRHKYTKKATERRRLVTMFHLQHAPYECELCQQKFETIAEIRAHIRDYVKTKCTICEKSFQNEKLLNCHLLTHSLVSATIEKSTDQQRECQKCSKQFTDSMKYHYHKTLHDYTEFFNCDLCGKHFNRKVTLELHMRNCHIKMKQYKCEICQHVFEHLATLKNHLKLVHIKEKHFNCTLCSKTFGNSFQLKQHQFQHTDEKPFKCDLCDKSFSVAGRLRRHLPIHSIQNKSKTTKSTLSIDVTLKKQIIKCTICKQNFGDQSSLDVHQKKCNLILESSDKPYECCLCQKDCMTAKFLRKHLVYEHGIESENGNISCGICLKSFTKRPSLNRHTYAHSREKPHKCNKCDKTFITASNLHIHQMVHSGEKPYKCDLCTKAFTRKGRRDKHVLLHSVKK